jgi:hypothetical protein
MMTVRATSPALIARKASLTVLADFLDDPRRFVAENGGRREHLQPSDEMQVGVADAARRRASENFTLRRAVDLHLFNRQRLVRAVE